MYTSDIALIKISVIMFTLWIVGLFSFAIDFIERWTWVFFALAVIIGIKPFWRFWFGKSAADNALPRRIKKFKKRR